VYGQTRPPSTSGQPLTLRRTGATEATLRFVAIGTIVRCVLGTPYAKYLIGNYRVLPMGRMPVQWSRDINDLVQRERF
jgi:Na+/glutamate symporter